jgi:hypothetical protein
VRRLGYPPAQAGLAKITFAWMLREAGLCGLQIDPALLAHEVNGAGAAPDPCADPHESLQRGWKAVEWIPVKHYDSATKQYTWHVPRGQLRNVERDADKPEVFLHQPVIDRVKNKGDYRPSNIPHNELDLRSLFKNKIET